MRRSGSARVIAGVLVMLLLGPASPASAGCPADMRFYESRRDVVPPEPSPAFVHALAAGDFNGDGRQDLVLAHVKFNEDVKFPPRILLNDPAGTFVDATASVIEGAIPTLWHARRILVADFNGDGRDDIFIAAHGIDGRHTGEPNTLLLSTPGGTLSDASDRIPRVNDFSHGAAAGDIDGDGDVDIIVGNLGGEFNASYVLMNDGTGRFTMDVSRLPAREQVLGSMGAVALKDVNRDGLPDLILGGYLDARIYLNDGAGRFLDSALIQLPPSPLGAVLAVTVDIQTADLDRDGHVDLVLSQTGRSPLYYLGRKIQILMGDGTGHFRDETDTRIPSAYLAAPHPGWYMSLYIADVDRDGFPDIVVSIPVTGGADVPADTPYLFVNDGNGNFRPLTASVFGPQPDRILGPLIPIDADGDGGLDFFSAGFRYQLIREIAPYGNCDAKALILPSARSLAAGQKLVLDLVVVNPPGAPPLDLYVGALWPDGNTIAFLGGPNTLGGLGEYSVPASIAPMMTVRGGFSTSMVVLEYTFPAEGIPVGTYQVFASLFRQGSLADNTLDDSDLVSLSFAPVAYQP